jgi:hypothetical protein
MTQALEVEKLIKQLRPELRQEVEDFVRFLMAKRQRKLKGKLRQDWAGALRDYGDRYSSLDLQKKALEWRGYGDRYSSLDLQKKALEWRGD